MFGVVVLLKDPILIVGSKHLLCTFQKAMFVDLKHFLSVEVPSKNLETATTALLEASPNMDLYGVFNSSLEETLTNG